jgi:hypothetical protein
VGDLQQLKPKVCVAAPSENYFFNMKLFEQWWGEAFLLKIQHEYSGRREDTVHDTEIATEQVSSMLDHRVKSISTGSGLIRRIYNTQLMLEL